ncbi:pyrroline-5-carboxylate reductase [Bacillus carboniphilus]
MEGKIGFIGCGRMARAIIEGMLSSEIVKPQQIMASAATDDTLDQVAEKYGIKVTSDNKEVAERAKYLFLAVKPNLHQKVIEEIKLTVSEETIVITMAAGVTLDFLRESFGENVKGIRTMPNTPSLVREGMTVLSVNDNVTKDELEDTLVLLETFGKVEVVAERLMDAIPAISGSSPAYVYMMIEAMADGGVSQGIPRDQAYKLAAQAVLGAAKMVLETGIHPGELKDQVCTPGGATIEAVATLEKAGFRSAIIAAMDSCTEKSKDMKG